MDLDKVFRLFDIRGEYPSEINERLAFAIGRSLGDLHHLARVLVASDIRPSSPTLKRYLADGLRQAKWVVFDALEIPTPQFYFSIATGNFDLGVMVTASHLDKTSNGFKFAARSGLPFDQQQILDLKKAVSRHLNSEIVVPHSEATIINTTDQYLRALSESFTGTNFESRVVIDLTESSISTTVLTLFTKLKIRFDLVKSKHPGNPLEPHSPRVLSTRVKETRGDLGIIWDSDGDRVIFIDANGEMIPGSFIIAVLAADTLKRSRKRKIAVDSRSGLVVRDVVAHHKGSLVIFPAWGQYLKFAMHDDPGVAFGGETSGHYIFRDFHTIDDGIYAALRFLRAYETGGRELLDSLVKRYFELPETNIPCPLDDSFSVLQKVTNLYRNSDLVQVHNLDGLTVVGSDYKFNLRESVTQPFLRLNIEAKSAYQAHQIMLSIQKQIESVR